jgi:hypothetical protein
MAVGQGGTVSEREEGGQSQEEFEAALAEQMRQLRLEQVIASTLATALELGFLRTGLGPGTENDRDLGQVEVAIETVRALLPVLVRFVPRETLTAYRQALSELQLAYAHARERPASGAPGHASPAAPPPETPVEKPPRPRIWTPGGEV